MNTEQQILKTVIDIKGEVGTITGDIKGIKEHLKTLNGSIQNHDDRINVNERKADTMSGKIKVIGAIATIIAGTVIASIKL